MATNQSQIFAIFDKLGENEMYCKACQNQFHIDNNLIGSIHNHIRTLNHQIVIHDSFNKQFRHSDVSLQACKEILSPILFSMSKAKRLYQNHKQFAQIYFGQKLKLIFHGSNLHSTSVKTYSSILKRKNYLSAEDIEDYLEIHNRNDVKSAIMHLLKILEITIPLMDKQITRQVKIQKKNQIKNNQLIHKNDFLQNFLRFVNELEAQGQNRLAILLKLMFYTDLNIHDIVQVKLSEIKGGENQLTYQNNKGKTIFKNFTINPDLVESVTVFQQLLSQNSNKKWCKALLKVRELQRELQQSKELILAQVEIRDDQYQKFVSDLQLRNIQQQKLQPYPKTDNSQKGEKKKSLTYKNPQLNNDCTQIKNNQNQQNSISQQTGAIDTTQDSENNSKLEKQNQIDNQKMIGQIKGLYRLAKESGLHKPCLQISDESLVLLDEQNEAQSELEKSKEQNNYKQATAQQQKDHEQNMKNKE